MVLETGEKDVSAIGSGASRGTGLEAEPQEAGVARGCVWRGPHSASQASRPF